LHIGIYNTPDESIYDASVRTVSRICDKISHWPAGTKVLDLGAGYGGSARYMAKHHGFDVDCLNISLVQNERNRQMNQEQGLADKIRVFDGSFEELPFENNTYDVLWSQDSILHSGNRRKVMEEADRVLKSGGDFVFTDPMQTDDCPEGVLEPVLARIHLDSLGSVGFYRQVAEELGWEFVEFDEQTHQLVNHYSRVLQELEAHYEQLQPECSKEYLDRMKVGLNHWINAGKSGYMAWGILKFHKP
ncbi:MAG: sarcosine/dimethylglycine N-methyltransferase, partial [Halothece sp. Uz-M2-17]|nr:sarcosine/dimethylglycine N-methyltransferase [Halothece sp. Uz-M2-17]